MFFTEATSKFCCSGVVVLNFEYISRFVLTFNFAFIFCNTNSIKKGVYCRSGVTMVPEFPKREEKFETLAGECKRKEVSRGDQPWRTTTNRVIQILT